MKYSAFANKKNIQSYPDLIVSSDENYIETHMLESGLEYALRRKNFKTGRILNQSFSNYWMLLRFQNYTCGQWRLFLEDSFTNISGSVYVYIPANILASWYIQSGTHQYETYLSHYPQTKDLPNEPLIFAADTGYKIQSYEDIVNLISANKDQTIPHYRKRLYVADKTKHFLDQYFAEELSFSQIAQELNIAKSSMTIGFKNYFGIAPIQYRNILRTFEAIRLIRTGMKVTDAGYQAGFKSLAQYNVHVHRNLGVAPSAFRQLKIS